MILPFGAIFLTGCLATSTEMTDIKDDMYNLQLKLDEVQGNQADLLAKMDNLGVDIKGLTSELKDTQNGMSLLNQRLDDIESNLSKRLDKFSKQISSSGTVSSSSVHGPSDIYRLAYGDFSRGQYDVAITGFRSYIDKYPNGELTGQANYYIGECLYAKGDCGEAINTFELFESNYPADRLVPASKLKRAVCMEKVGRGQDSIKLLKKLIEDFPDSPEAATAKEKLERSGQLSAPESEMSDEQ